MSVKFSYLFLRRPFNYLRYSTDLVGRSNLQNKCLSSSLIFQSYFKSFSTQTTTMDVQKTKPKIAVLQMTATANKEKNFEVCRHLIEEASKCGAEMVFLPEACDYIAESNSQSLEMAEGIEGPLISNFRQLAKTHNIWISIGGFHNKCPEGGKMLNTHLIVSSTGDIQGQYDKVHLFDVELPDKRIKLRESDYIQHGKKVAEPIDTPVGKIGLGICYDLRFPEFSLSLAHKGAQILTYPSAFTVPTGMAHWESLLRCRAIETQCYVVAAAQTGSHNVKRSSYGHAMIIDPWGTVLAQCGEGTSIALATVDLEYLSKIRREIPVLSHRRPDLYHPIRMLGHDPLLPTNDELFTFGQVTVRGCMVFYRSQLSVAFVNKKCVVPGHVLVIPIRLVQRFVDLQPDEVADLFQTARHVQRGMELLHQVTSSTLTIQDGPDAGQTIHHVHVHILPRRPGDFERNDDIYHQLERHDHGPDVQWREEHEMEEEARKLREFFSTLS